MTAVNHDARANVERLLSAWVVADGDVQRALVRREPIAMLEQLKSVRAAIANELLSAEAVLRAK